MAELVFFSGTMDCGKSTLALQVDHNHGAAGRDGLVFSRFDRGGAAVLSSRLGLSREAQEVSDDTDFRAVVLDARMHGRRVDYLICDEAQFYRPEQVDQLARVVDELGVDVYAFGITSDFRTKLFPGSARLIELADRVQRLQVEALCWCGSKATHNARTLDGAMVRTGEQVVIGDVRQRDGHQQPDGQRPDGGPHDGDPRDGVVGYEVLCRRHHVAGTTARIARAAPPSADVLPWSSA